MARPSHIRSAISELVSASSRHDWTIDDVVGELERRGVDADFSSVFRGLSRLAEDGTVQRVELGDGKARFEAARDHHEHVRCERCGAVGEVAGCLVDRVVPAVEEQTGFAVTGHRLLFSGLCGACAPGGAS
jgi:Fe2+ or Zn2+ uptake regulation protein